MSGGSYDYAYCRIEDLASQIRPRNALRKAFAAHLALVAKAAHDIEWVDSCDKSPGDEDEAIRACLAPGAELAHAVADARLALAELEGAIARAAKP